MSTKNTRVYVAVEGQPTEDELAGLWAAGFTDKGRISGTTMAPGTPPVGTAESRVVSVPVDSDEVALGAVQTALGRFTRAGLSVIQSA